MKVFVRPEGHGAVKQSLHTNTTWASAQIQGLEFGGCMGDMPLCISTRVWRRFEAASPQKAATRLQLKPASVAFCCRGLVHSRLWFRITASQCPPCPQRTHQNLAGIASAAQAHRVPGRLPPISTCLGTADLAMLNMLSFWPSRRSSRAAQG